MPRYFAEDHIQTGPIVEDDQDAAYDAFEKATGYTPLRVLEIVEERPDGYDVKVVWETPEDESP